MRNFWNFLLIGVSNGLVYALVALGIVLIYRSTRVINFALAAMAMFSTYIAASLIDMPVMETLPRDMVGEDDEERDSPPSSIRTGERVDIPARTTVSEAACRAVELHSSHPL